MKKSVLVVALLLASVFLIGCSETAKQDEDFTEEPHPFSVALRDFNETIPDDFRDYDDIEISHTYAYIIDIDGNGTMGVVAYKAFGEIDHHSIFYLHNGELKTVLDGAGGFYYLHEIGERPLVILGGGEGAGRIYSVYSLTVDGLIVTSTLWASVHGEFEYNNSSVSEEEFTSLLEQYNLNDERWLVLDRKPHVMNGQIARAEAINPRNDDTALILAMTMPIE